MRQPQTHELKTWRAPFGQILKGNKTFEYRKDDRDFHDGDTLILREWDEYLKDYTGREITADVPYIIKGVFGIPEGYCVMSIKPR